MDHTNLFSFDVDDFIKFGPEMFAMFHVSLIVDYNLNIIRINLDYGEHYCSALQRGLRRPDYARI
jgi:hypothetical protein